MPAGCFAPGFRNRALQNPQQNSVLLDLSNFYDRIDLLKLCERWRHAGYPNLHAAFAMQVYLGSRVLEAEGESSQPIWTRKGILAGDPQAPLVAKVYLKRAMEAFRRKSYIAC